MNKLEIENRIKEIDNNLKSIFFKSIIESLKLERNSLVKKLNKLNK